ncbi:MAG: hypothetical protein ACI4J1_02465, partial [Ruminiclostridium sp.]
MNKETLSRIGKRITAFAVAASMALSFVIPVELGGIDLDWGVIEASAEADIGDGNPTALDVSQGSITITDTSVSGYDGSGVEVTTVDPDGYIITGTTTENTITVSGTQNIVLNGVNIDVSGKTGACAFKVEDNNTGTVTVTLADDSVNTLTSGDYCAGLQKNGDGAGIGKLIIKGGANGTGKLTATSGYYGAGIGSGNGANASDITISGGIVTATGFLHGPGIGSGEGGSASDITISGGTVTAKGGTHGAGIGCSKGGSASDITISGGTVTATGGSRGAGIGGGYSAGASDITISGGIVSVKGGNYGAGIGGGYSAGASDITISGGIVTAEGGIDAAGIGGGSGSSGTNITISGGSVKAVGYPNANDIGGGNGKSAVAPTLADGTTNVFLSTIDTGSVTNSIVIDGVEYPTTHNGEAKIYPYFSEGFHTIVIDGSTEEVVYMRNDGSLTQSYVAQTVGDFVVYGGTLNTDYSYSGNVLTINGVTPLMIKNTVPTTPTTDRIEVASGTSANITLAGVNIDVSGKDNTCAFKIEDNSNAVVTITLAGGTENKLKSGSNCAGLQKNGTAGSLEIKGSGTVTATGGQDGAGIGGGFKGSASDITISGGTVIAISSKYGAGIGGGAGFTGGAGSDITISGGTVTATGGDGGAGIGGGHLGSASGITISGGTVTATGVIGGAGIGSGVGGSGSGITISGGSVLAQGGKIDVNGVEYSGAAIGNGVEIVDPETNEVSNGTHAAVTNGTENVYLCTIPNENSDPVYIDGTLYTLSNHTAADPADTNLYAYLTGKPHTITVGTETTDYMFDRGKGNFVIPDLILSGESLVYGVDYSYENVGFVILSPKAITVSGRTTKETVTVADGISANITLAGVNIAIPTTANKCAFKITDDSAETVTITLADGSANTLTSGYNSAGLQKNGINGKLIIQCEHCGEEGHICGDSCGSLEANGGNYGAGIGGGYNQPAAGITISGGTVTANGGTNGAGIGGGKSCPGSDITISGGIVTAKCTDSDAAGIGGGNSGSGYNITISGGTVTATGGKNGAGIGGGNGGDGWQITISDSTVTATGGTNGAGIGGGNGGNGGAGFDINISGDSTVTATGGAYAAGIGGGYGNSGSGITISGGKVTATGGYNGGAGIGGGKDGDGLRITISGGTVIAAGGKVTYSTITEYGGAGIGGGSNGSGTKIKISGSTVTAIGGENDAGNYKGAGIGGGYNGSCSDVIISGGSVKASGSTAIGGGSTPGGGSMFEIPTNGAETAPKEVYLLEILNENGDPVYIDGTLYTPSDHTAADPGDKTLYAYITGENHEVKVGETTTTYIFDGQDSFGRLGTNLVIAPNDENNEPLVYGVDYEYSTAHLEFPNTLIVKTDRSVIISNANPSASTTDRIFVADGISADITLKVVNIDASMTANGCAFRIAEQSKGNVTITLKGENTLISGEGWAAIQKEGIEAIDGSDVGKLLIQGDGSLVAKGGTHGAAIGGGYLTYGCKNIEIAGGNITAVAGSSAAAIGSGLYGHAKDITISGGTVTVEGSYRGAGIGTCTNVLYDGTEYECSNIQITGGSVKITVQPGHNTIGKGYGGEAVIPTNAEGKNVYPFALANPLGAAVTVDGTAYSPASHGDGSLYLYLTAEPHTITVGNKTICLWWDPIRGELITSDEIGTNFVITSTDGSSAPVYGEDYIYHKDDGVLKILSDKPMTITGGTMDSADRIEIAANVDGNITLAGVTITGNPAITIAEGSGNVTITLADGTVNTLAPVGEDSVGIQKNGTDSSLTITGGGALNIECGKMGIGGENATANITIDNGLISIDSRGTGIGGENTSNIIINGGSLLIDSTGTEIGTQPKNSSGDNVYLLVVPNPDGREVSVDNTPVEFKNQSTNDPNLYLYLTGTNHDIKVGNETTEYKFYDETGTFLPIPKASDFTFTLPGNLVYDRNKKAVTVTAKSGITGMGTVMVKYYDKNGAPLNSAPTDVGTYTVKIDVTKGTAYAEVTNLTATAWAFEITSGGLKASDFKFTAPANLVYDGNGKTATVTATDEVANSIGEITVKYFDKDGDPLLSAPTDVGTYTVKIDVAAG